MSKCGVGSEWCSDDIKGSNVCQCVSTPLHYKKQAVLSVPGKTFTEFTSAAVPVVSSRPFKAKGTCLSLRL